MSCARSNMVFITLIPLEMYTKTYLSVLVGNSGFPMFQTEMKRTRQQNGIWMRVSRYIYIYLHACTHLLCESICLESQQTPFGIRTHTHTHTGAQSLTWAVCMRRAQWNEEETILYTLQTRTHACSSIRHKRRAAMSTAFSSVYVYRPYRAVEYFSWNATALCVSLNLKEKKIDRFIRNRDERQHLYDDWYRHLFNFACEFGSIQFCEEHINEVNVVCFCLFNRVTKSRAFVYKTIF